MNTTFSVSPQLLGVPEPRAWELLFEVLSNHLVVEFPRWFGDRCGVRIVPGSVSEGLFPLETDHYGVHLPDRAGALTWQSLGRVVYRDGTELPWRLASLTWEPRLCIRLLSGVPVLNFVGWGITLFSWLQHLDTARVHSQGGIIEPRSGVKEIEPFLRFLRRFEYDYERLGRFIMEVDPGLYCRILPLHTLPECLLSTWHYRYGGSNDAITAEVLGFFARQALIAGESEAELRSPPVFLAHGAGVGGVGGCELGRR